MNDNQNYDQLRKRTESSGNQQGSGVLIAEKNKVWDHTYQTAF
jgi:hypothetical protein